MNPARFGRSASKCGENNARPMRFEAMKSCWALNPTAGTARLSSAQGLRGKRLVRSARRLLSRSR
jgi:hypothetical protein